MKPSMLLIKFSGLAFVCTVLLAASADAGSSAQMLEPASPLIHTAYVAPQVVPTLPVAQATGSGMGKQTSGDEASDPVDLSALPMLMLGLAAVGIGVFRRNRVGD